MGSTPVYQKAKKAVKTGVRIGAATMTFGSSEAAIAASKIPGQIKEGKAMQKAAEASQAKVVAEDAEDNRRKKVFREAKRKSLAAFSQTGPLGLAGANKANTTRRRLLGN